MKIILGSGRQDVPQVSAFVLPLLKFLACFLIPVIQIRQHNYTIVIVVHSLFIADVHDAVELLSLLVLFSLLYNPLTVSIFLPLSFLLLVDEAEVMDSSPHKLFMTLMVAINAVLVLFDQLYLPHLTRTTHLRQCHNTTLTHSDLNCACC